jgi:hypothetical protein
VATVIRQRSTATVKDATCPKKRAWKNGPQSVRKRELKIDPDTAEVNWHYAQTLDSYGVDPNLPEECRQIGREYFARSPGSDIWVHFHDLPEETRDALWERHESKLAFPAGLEQLLQQIR